MPEPPFFLRLLSTPQLLDQERKNVLLAAGKPLALLAYLDLEAKAVSREELASLLWPEADGQHGRASVRQAVWTLRRVLGQDCFTSDDPIALAEGVLITDLDLLHAALDGEDLESARRLWTGPPLADLEFPHARGWQGWLDNVRLTEERRFGEALHRAAAAEMDRGRPQTAARWLGKAVEVQPLRLSNHLALIEALIQSHTLSEAGEALARARALVSGADPHPELDELEERLDVLRYGTPDSMEPPSFRTEFVGRVSEFSRLARAWRSVLGGHPQVATVLGPPGIGKTRLAEEMALLARADGGTVVTVKAVEVERSLEWGLASDLVRVLHGLPGAAGISNRSASVLAQLVPSLAGWTRSGTAADGGPGQVGPAAITDALLDLVSAVSEEAPMLLVVDDLQWVDRNSRAALSHLVRAATRKPVFVLFTCRTGEKDPEVAKAVEALARSDGPEAVELGPLTQPEVSELLTLTLEPREPEELDDLAARVYAVTRGNPLFLVEVFKLLQAEALIQSNGDGRWSIHPSCLEGPLPVPQTVESAIRRHLENLDASARQVAAYLADRARPVPVEDLRRLGTLDPFEVSEGVRGLFERDLIRRDPEGRLEFIHDAVAAAARRHLKPPAPESKLAGLARSWGRWYRVAGAAAVAVVAVAALVLAIDARTGGTWLLGRPGQPEDDYPFGHGRFQVIGDSDTYWVTPPSTLGGEWIVAPGETPYPQLNVYGPLYTPTDTLWFAMGSDGPEWPPYVGIPREDGSVEPVWKVNGDVGFLDLSPDGRWLLVMQQNLEAQDYRHNLVRVDLATGQGRTLYEAPNRLAGCDWSPDGEKIACVTRWASDSLRIFTPDGLELKALGLPGSFSDLAGPAWCQDSDAILLRAGRSTPARLALARVLAETVQVLSYREGVYGAMGCTGESPMGLAGGVMDNAPALLWIDIAADSAAAVPGFPEQRIHQIRWVPEQRPVVVQEVRIPEDTLLLPLGERRTLSAGGVRTSGDTLPVEAVWTTAEPAVASVDSTGRITANGEGEVQVMARYAQWLEDTVLVRVTPVDHPDVLFQETFESGALERWVTFGDPLPELEWLNGQSVLSLTGDGRYTDGLVARDSFDLQTGATAELEFKLLLTRTEHQRLSLIVEQSAPTAVQEPDPWLARPPGDWIRIAYPHGEDIKFDPQVAVLTFGNLSFSEGVQLPSVPDPSQWTHMALQVRPDGTVSVVWNRRVIYESQHKLLAPPGTHWRLRIDGASEDSWTYVRNVTVWPEERY